MSVPAGTVIAYSGLEQNLNKLKQQFWLLCDGKSYNTGDYPALVDAIGTTYGGGEGTFKVPDLSGMFLRGLDSSGIYDPDGAQRTSPDPSARSNAKPPALPVVGPVIGSRQTDEVRNHQHQWDQNFGQISSDGSDLNVQLAVDSPTGGWLGTSPTTLVDGGGDETRPCNVYVYYLIYAGN